MDLDEQLMVSAGAGDDEAFRTLARRHRSRLEAFALRFLGDREEAQDVAQEALIRLWRAAPRYQPEGRFQAYLFTLARNVCRSKSAAGRGCSEGALVETLAARPRPGNPRLEEVGAAVQRLPEAYREVLLLSLQGLSYDEIGKTLGCPRGTVASRKAAAVRLLRERLAPLISHPEGETTP